MILHIGTRRSSLAIWQAQYIQKLLKRHHPDQVTELVFFTTRGEQIVDKPLSEVGGKGLFTTELEEALRSEKIDLAVHSLKDLPTEMDDLFTIGAIPERASPFDALVSRGKKNLSQLPPGAVIGTSSLRRSAQLKAFRTDFTIKAIRGNIDTRLQKILAPSGEYDAAILAVAGLERLDKSAAISEILNPNVMLPAPGQGALAVQCRASDEGVLRLLAPLDHAETRACVTAERAFLRRLDAGCRLPVSAYATVNGQILSLTGRVSSLDGRQVITLQGESEITASASPGNQLAEQALTQGAAELLAAIQDVGNIEP